MEYGIWSLHAAGGLWADPRLARRHPILGPGVPSAAAFALSTLQRPLDRIAMPVATSGLAYRAMELVTRTRTTNDSSASPTTQAEKSVQDNESNIETRNDRGGDDENSNQTPNLPASNADDGAEESDLGSVSSGNEHSRHSVNNNMHGKPRDGFPCLLLDKDEAVPPVLNSWVIGAYTAMLGRLSAVTAGLEGAELPNVVSDSGSESDDSSYTEKSRGCGSPNGVSHRGYSCGSCEVVAATRPALRKHITDAHPTVSSLDGGEARRCPASGCEFTTGSRCEMETHVAAHVAQGMSPTGKKRSLALQRVRYEREEYRCSLCSYACTIEKAFQRHLRAHARGTAPETRVSCPVCGADRTSEVDLSRHMRRHRADRYFCCDICIFRTVQLKKLIQHRRMHTGEKPHLCPHCAYRSARRDNLRSHVRRVHKKENLYCDTFSPRGMLISPTSQPQVKSPASSPASTAGSAN